MKLIITLLVSIIGISSYSQKAENLYKIAKLNYHNLEYEDALKNVNLAIEKSRKYYDAYLLRADIYYSLDDSLKAIEDLDKTIEMFPMADRSYFLKGMIYYDYDDFSKAWPNFEKATELFKHDADYFFYKGETALKLKNSKDACISWAYGATKLDDKDCESKFDKNCTDIDITVAKDDRPKRKSLKELLTN